LEPPPNIRQTACYNLAIRKYIAQQGQRKISATVEGYEKHSRESRKKAAKHAAQSLTT